MEGLYKFCEGGGRQGSRQTGASLSPQDTGACLEASSARPAPLQALVYSTLASNPRRYGLWGVSPGLSKISMTFFQQKSDIRKSIEWPYCKPQLCRNAWHRNLEHGGGPVCCRQGKPHPRCQADWIWIKKLPIGWAAHGTLPFDVQFHWTFQPRQISSDRRPGYSRQARDFPILTLYNPTASSTKIGYFLIGRNKVIIGRE